MGANKRFLVTGGAGFIGSHLVDYILAQGHRVVILDALSYGARISNLPQDVQVVGGLHGQRTGELPEGDCVLVVGDVADAPLVKQLIAETDGCFHLAAQTHVDRSYGDVLPFVNSNMVGAYAVLEALRAYPDRRLLFMSTDEVYGDKGTGYSKETDPITPRNVYSTLKAGGDILAQTYAKVFGLNILIARPANNYGPRQFEEKLVPKILSILLTKDGRKIPVYGQGDQIRDWLYVEDCCSALWTIYEKGSAGGSIYNVAAHQFRTVMQVVESITGRLLQDPKDWIQYVPDRICGDQRYALDMSVIQALGWKPETPFDEGLNKTMAWYMLHSRAGTKVPLSSSSCGH